MKEQDMSMSAIAIERLEAKHLAQAHALSAAVRWPTAGKIGSSCWDLAAASRPWPTTNWSARPSGGRSASTLPRSAW
jgi:hypothetical protein